MRLIALFVICGLAAIQAQESSRPEFGPWLDGVRQEALDRGISPATVGKAFDGLTPLEVVVQRDRSQAETVLTVDEYVRRRLTPAFVKTANQRAAAERAVLAKISKQYGVSPRVLVTICGSRIRPAMRSCCPRWPATFRISATI